MSHSVWVVNALNAIGARLPGVPAAPSLPLEPRNWAAVAAVLRSPRGGSPEVLLIRRAERRGDPWSGHMALPGGRWEPGDASLVETALRETQEEVALDLRRNARLLGMLPPVTATAGTGRVKLRVQPVVSELQAGQPQLSAEVAEVLWVSLEALRAGHLNTSFEFRHGGVSRCFPGFRLGDQVVWGLTHRILRRLLQLGVDNAAEAR